MIVFLSRGRLIRESGPIWGRGAKLRGCVIFIN